MATSKRTNDNYIHSCGLEQTEIDSKIMSISKMNFTSEQVVAIIEFFLFFAPVLKSDKKAHSFGLKSLRDYGWSGTSSMTKLEGQLLRSSGIGIFCFIKSDSIDETLKTMNLGDKICTVHPRAVMKQNIKLVSFEDGSAEVRQQETRMECLFRHVRNSIAHNRTYLFDNDNIMLEDSDDNGKISARIVMPRTSLLNWISIVTQGNISTAMDKT